MREHLSPRPCRALPSQRATRSPASAALPCSLRWALTRGLAAGGTADALTLFERLEARLEEFPGQLTRAATSLARDWRTDKYLRRLEATMVVTDGENAYLIR